MAGRDTNLRPAWRDRPLKPFRLHAPPQFELPKDQSQVNRQQPVLFSTSNRTGYSNVNVSYVQYRDWELIPLIQHNKSLPNPQRIVYVKRSLDSQGQVGYPLGRVA